MQHVWDIGMLTEAAEAEAETDVKQYPAAAKSLVDET